MPRTLTVGATNNRCGVTLLELLIVITLMSLLAGLAYPSASAGLDTIRLRAASDQAVSFLNAALDRAQRRQQVVELRISPAENALAARSADVSFDRTLSLAEPVRIASVEPAEVNAISTGAQRRFLIYPGGTLPRIVIHLATRDGRRREVVVDPVTGAPHTEMPAK